MKREISVISNRGKSSTTPEVSSPFESEYLSVIEKIKLEKAKSEEIKLHMK